jgi:hypothetical protein
MHVFKRMALLGFACSGLMACTPVMKGIGEGLLLATGVGQPALEDRATQPNVGYLKVSSGQQALFVLGFLDHGQEIWYGPGPSALTMTHGIVLRSSGLGDDLLSEEWQGDGARYLTEGLHTLPENQTVALTKLRSLGSDYRWQVKHHYLLKRVGNEQVQAWGGTKPDVIRVEEIPVNTKWPGNTYWVLAKTGEIVASEQWLSPQRRFALVPREPHEKRELSVAAAPQASVASQGVENQQRLSEWLLQHPGYEQLLPANLVILSQHWPTPAAKQLRLRVQLDLRQAQAATQGAEQQAYAALATWLAKVQIAARVPVTSTDPYWLRANPTKDPVLQAGDRIGVAAAARDISVIRASGLPCHAQFVPMSNVQDYLSVCDSDNSGRNNVWLLQPDGAVSEQGIALWNKSPQQIVAPGAWLALLPNDYNRHAGDLGAAKHLMQLLNQIQAAPASQLEQAP